MPWFAPFLRRSRRLRPRFDMSFSLGMLSRLKHFCTHWLKPPRHNAKPATKVTEKNASPASRHVHTKNGDTITTAEPHKPHDKCARAGPTPRAHAGQEIPFPMPPPSPSGSTLHERGRKSVAVKHHAEGTRFNTPRAGQEACPRETPRGRHAVQHSTRRAGSVSP